MQDTKEFKQQNIIFKRKGTKKSIKLKIYKGKWPKLGPSSFFKTCFLPLIALKVLSKD